jgi:hypothetical protein
LEHRGERAARRGRRGEDPPARRFGLPAAHAPVLVDRDDVRFGAYRAIDVVRAARPMPDMVDACRDGTAPPPLAWEPEGRAADNRAVYLTYLGNEWLPAIPEVDRRLRAQPPALVADLACGLGWSSIAIARAYPLVTVHGFDLDAAVIASAVRPANWTGCSPCWKPSVSAQAPPTRTSCGPPRNHSREGLKKTLEKMDTGRGPVCAETTACSPPHVGFLAWKTGCSVQANGAPAHIT